MCKVLKTDGLNVIKQSKNFCLIIEDNYSLLMHMGPLCHGYHHLNPQKNLCCSYLFIAEVLQAVRTQLKWREKSRHQAVVEWFHLVLLRSFLCSTVACLLLLAGVLTATKASSLFLTFLLLLLSWCYSYGVGPANLDIILISDFSWEETVTRVRMTPSFPSLFPILSFIAWSLH